MISSRPAANEVVDALNAAIPTLDPAEQGLVLELYRALMAGKPVAVPDLAAGSGWEVSKVEDALRRWPGVYRAKDGRIIGFWGLAVRGMPHRLSSDAGHLTTWCALDPLLIAPLVTDEAHVESADPVSGEPISLVVTPAGLRDVSPATAVVSMLLPRGPFSHDVVESFCHYVHFFASEQTGRRWTEEHPGTFLLSVDQAFDVARRSWPALLAAAPRPDGVSRS
jgi:alkylmercury lyase